MKTNDVIKTLDTEKFFADLKAKIDKHPKGSLSKREVLESINLGDMSFEEAQKIADELNSSVTKAILNFKSKLKIKK